MMAVYYVVTYKDLVFTSKAIFLPFGKTYFITSKSLVQMFTKYTNEHFEWSRYHSHNVNIRHKNKDAEYKDIMQNVICKKVDLTNNTVEEINLLDELKTRNWKYYKPIFVEENKI